MSEEELYKLAISDVPTYSLLNEILAIRDNRFPNEEADYCINVNGYISLDVLNKYVKVVQENKQLREEQKYNVPIVEHNQIVSKKNKEMNQLKEVIEEVREYIEKECSDLLIGYFHNRFDATEYYEKLLQILDKATKENK